MTDARQNRGSGNNYGKAWHESKLWDNIDAKNKRVDGCQHNSIKFTANGKVCNQCGERL